MRRLLLISMVIPIAVALVLAVAGCGSGDGDDPPSTPATSAGPLGRGTAPPPGASGSGEPVVDCMAQKGFKVDSPDDIQTPEAQQALSECLQVIHGGGGGLPPY
jgi:hypothetical protein